MAGDTVAAPKPGGSGGTRTRAGPKPGGTTVAVIKHGSRSFSAAASKSKRQGQIDARRNLPKFVPEVIDVTDDEDEDIEAIVQTAAEVSVTIANH